MENHYSSEQIIGFLRETDACQFVNDVGRRHWFSEAPITSGAATSAAKQSSIRNR